MSKQEIIQGDCLEVMRGFADKSFDLCLCDPPYGIGIDGQKESHATKASQDRKYHAFGGWDNEIPNQEYFDEIMRVSKNQIICGGNYFLPRLNEGHKGWVVWDKGQRGLTMSDGELIYTSFDVPLRIFTFNRNEIKVDGSHHPTLKPVKLFLHLLGLFSKESDTILDPFLGSGTTLVAAKQLNRNATGIEISPEYCEIARQRLAQSILL